MLSVYNYKDPISFLSHYIDWKKINEESFSLKAWAHSLGLKSAAPILDVLQGKKKLRGKLLEAMMKELPIDQSEMIYFQEIVERVSATNEEKILMYDLLINELSPTKKTNYSCLRDSQIDLYTHWIYMAILSMAKLDHFKLTADNIKNKLAESLDEEMIEDALQTLFNVGLLTKDKDGNLIREHSSYSNKTNATIESFPDYFTLICELAKKATFIDYDLREFQCFSFALSQKNLPVVKEIIRKARRQIALLAEEQQQKDTVYQANLVVFPLTKELDS